MCCRNNANAREVRQFTKSYNRHMRLWFFFSHLNCNELEKTRPLCMERYQLCTSEGCKTYFFASCYNPVKTHHVQLRSFLLNIDLFAVGEAGEKHQEAIDGAARLSVSKESWQDQEAASNWNWWRSSSRHSRRKSSLESNEETKIKGQSRMDQ